MPLVGEERREFQRLTLEPPIAATLGQTPVSIVEIGVLGARVVHASPIDDEYPDLRFTARDAEITLRCEVVRRTGDAPRLQSGIRFLAAVEESGNRLRLFLARLAADTIAARRKTLKDNITADAAVDGDRTVRGKDARFLCFRMEGERWRKTRAFLPEQPSNGFTVAQWVDASEIDRLCHAFAAADREGRRLIQLFAELSVSDELEIPPRA